MPFDGRTNTSQVAYVQRIAMFKVTIGPIRQPDISMAHSGMTVCHGTLPPGPDAWSSSESPFLVETQKVLIYIFRVNEFKAIGIYI